MVRAGILFLAITFALVFHANAQNTPYFIQAVRVFFPNDFQSILDNPQVIGVISTDMHKIPYETSSTMADVCETLVKYEISQTRGIEGEDKSVNMLPATVENVIYWDMSKIFPEAGMKPDFYVICERPSTLFRPLHVAVFCRRCMLDACGFYGGDGNLNVDCWGSKAVVTNNPHIHLVDYDLLIPAENLSSDHESDEHESQNTCLHRPSSRNRGSLSRMYDSFFHRLKPSLYHRIE